VATIVNWVQEYLVKAASLWTPKDTLSNTGIHVLFVCPLFNRWKNAPAAIFTNLLGLWPYARWCTFCLVTWGDDWPGLAMLLRRAEIYLQAKLLRVASGGTAGNHLRDAGFDATLTLQADVERMDYWHEARARNAGALFARQVHEVAVAEGSRHDRPFLVMLDADSVLSPESLRTSFSSAVLSETASHASYMYAASATMGHSHRVGCYLQNFLDVGGYDEDETLAPVGWFAQDMRPRLQHVAERDPAAIRQLLQTNDDLGAVLSNDTDIATEDIRAARIANVHPEIVASFNASYMAMRSWNMERMRLKMNQRIVVRNDGSPRGTLLTTGPNVDWHILALRKLDEAIARSQSVREEPHGQTSSGSGAEAAPAPLQTEGAEGGVEAAPALSPMPRPPTEPDTTHTTPPGLMAKQRPRPMAPPSQEALRAMMPGVADDHFEDTRTEARRCPKTCAVALLLRCA